MAIPTYDHWMKATRLGAGHPRSPKLKKIDSALKAYGKGPSARGQKDIRLALMDWMLWKGEWKSSTRNRQHIIEELKTNAFSGFPVPLSAEEREGIEYILQARDRKLKRLFANRKLTLRRVKSVQEVRAQHKSLKEAKEQLTGESSGSGASNADVGGPGGGSAVSQAVESMVREMFDGEAIGVVRSHLMSVVGADLIADMIPVVAQISGGAKAVKSWGTAARTAWTRHNVSQGAYALSGQDPVAAFDAVKVLLRRQITAESAEAGIVTAGFLVNLGAIADFGVISGPTSAAAKTLAQVAHKVFLLGREYKEARSANRVMAGPGALDFQVFATNPLVGCYMIRCSDLSDIINTAALDFGRSDMVANIESLKLNQIDPLRTLAERYIKESIYEIKGMPLLPAGGDQLSFESIKNLL